jgi:rhodanese-related sulfurtransferase
MSIDNNGVKSGVLTASIVGWIDGNRHLENKTRTLNPMKRITMIVMFGVLALTVAACGGGGATTGAVVPGPDAPVITPDTYESSVVGNMDYVLVDVREVNEVSSTGVIPGAINMPLSSFSSTVTQLPQDTTIVVYCNSGNRSRQAARILTQNGYDQLLDLTGIQQWRRAGKQLVPLGQ